MPKSVKFRKSRKSRKSRRIYRKKSTKSLFKKKGYRGDAMMYKGIGIGDKFFTKLKYSQSFTMTTGLGLYSVQQFRGNSLYDPDMTGTGAQPSFYDQICAPGSLYSRSCVIACKIKLRCCAAGDTFAIGNVDVAVTPSTLQFASTSWASIDDQLASKGTKRVSTVRFDNAGAKYITHYATAKQMFDFKDYKDNIPNIAALYNGLPTLPWYWIIGIGGMDRSSTTASVNILAELTYYTMFYYENMPAQS